MKLLLILISLFVFSCAENDIETRPIEWYDKFSCMIGDGENGEVIEEIYYKVDFIFKDIHLESEENEIAKVDIYYPKGESKLNFNPEYDLVFTTEVPFTKVGNLVELYYEHEYLEADDENLDIKKTIYKTNSTLNIKTLRLKESFVTEPEKDWSDSDPVVSIVPCREVKLAKDQ